MGLRCKGVTGVLRFLKGGSRRPPWVAGHPWVARPGRGGSRRPPWVAGHPRVAGLCRQQAAPLTSLSSHAGCSTGPGAWSRRSTA